MKKYCEFCNGSGQINYFKGVSRFLLSSEDCPECAGLGLILSEETADSGDTAGDRTDTSEIKKRN